MPTKEKAKNIEQAKDWYTRSSGVVFTDYRGLSVKDVQQLRGNLKSKGAELHVVKNTLFRIAAGEDAGKLPDELHNGPTAIAFVFENESECAKALFDYAKTHKSLKVKGGFFGGRAFTQAEVETLSTLPSRDVLISQVIGTIAAPLTNLVGVIEALYADPIRTIGAVADKVAEGTPVATATEKPAEAELAVETPEQTAPEATEPAETTEVAQPAEEATDQPTEE